MIYCAECDVILEGVECEVILEGVKDDVCPYCDQPVSCMNEDGEER